MTEFNLIAHIRQRSARLSQVLLGIGDDCALITPPTGQVLAVTSDTLNAGVHFPHDTCAADIGHKALAVNLSDLAAMGAQAGFCTLALSLPSPDASWLDGFLDGFLALAQTHQVALVGGDTTRGSLSINVTAHGWVPPQAALRRNGAQVGDDIWVTGTLGDAAAGLAQLLGGEHTDAALLARLNRPTPRLAVGMALRGIASACIDVSDGLLQDLGHICQASGVAAQVQLAALPASPALLALGSASALYRYQATGGDDYELCFTAAPAQSHAVQAIAMQLDLPITRIGRVVTGEGVQAYDADGALWQPNAAGYQHFA